MSKVSNILLSSVIFCSAAFPALAMEQGYDKLSIIAEVDPTTRNAIHRNVQTDEAKANLPQGVKLTRIPKAGYHISLDCYNYDHPQDQTLHNRFNDSDVNFLYRMMGRFANHPKRQQGSYSGFCYDIQLWCHIKNPKQNFHFAMKDHSQDGVFSIDKLPAIIGQATGNKVDYAHLVLRVGTKGAFRDDWDKLIHGVDPVTKKAQGGILVGQDKERIQQGERPMTPHYLEYGTLKTHISVGRLDNFQNDGTAIPFSGEAELTCLQNTFINIASKYNKVPIEIKTFRVTTRDRNNNGHMLGLGNPQNL